jgi:hypothetical protein
MTLEFKDQIVDRARLGESMQVIADDFGVSRERIRQIAALDGVTGASVRAERRERALSEAALTIIENRENWIPAKFADLPFTRQEFQVYLMEHDLPLYRRWTLAQELPLSRSGVSDASGKVCGTCRVHKLWDEFYQDRSRMNGKASRCKDCAKLSADKVRRARNVTEPTVLKKMCLRCGKVRAASRFSRSTTSTTGLQQYCKSCQAEYEKTRRDA